MWWSYGGSLADRLSVADVAAALGVRPDVVRGWIRAGVLRARRRYTGPASVHWTQRPYVWAIRPRAVERALEEPAVLRDIQRAQAK